MSSVDVVKKVLHKSGSIPQRGKDLKDIRIAQEPYLNIDTLRGRLNLHSGCVPYEGKILVNKYFTHISIEHGNHEIQLEI